MTEHIIRASGAGWLCDCGAWGFNAFMAEKHMKDTQTSDAEKAVDAAYERNLARHE